MDQSSRDVRIATGDLSTYFTVWTSGVGFTDKLNQFNPFYRLGRSLNYLYVHTLLQSPRSSPRAFEFLGFNTFLAKLAAPPPFPSFRFLDIGVSQEIIENNDLSSFEKLQEYINALVTTARLQMVDHFVVRFGIGAGGRSIYPIIHDGCKHLPDQINLLEAYRQARRLEPRASLFRPNKKKILVHMRQGDTGVIETPWHTFISTWNIKPDEYLQEFDSYDKLSKDHIEIAHFYKFMRAFQSQFVDELSIAFCSDGYQQSFDCLLKNIGKFNFDDRGIGALREISQSYDDQKFRPFGYFADSVLQVGENEEHFFDLVNSMVEADIIVTGTQQTMVVQFISRCYDLGKPKIILMLHRGGMIPDRRWHDLSEAKSALIPIDVEDYNIEEVCHLVRSELEKCATSR